MHQLCQLAMGEEKGGEDSRVTVNSLFSPALIQGS